MKKRGFRLFVKKKSMNEFCDRLDTSKLTLSSLPTLEFDPELVKKIDEEDDRFVEELKQKYGDDWLEHYIASMTPDYDSMEKCVNISIYDGAFVRSTGGPSFDVELHRRYAVRTKELYGDSYGELIHHAKGDERVAKILIDDAIKTGKWKELPDELQAEYHDRVGD